MKLETVRTAIAEIEQMQAGDGITSESGEIMVLVAVGLGYVSAATAISRRPDMRIDIEYVSGKFNAYTPEMTTPQIEEMMQAATWNAKYKSPHEASIVIGNYFLMREQGVI